MADWLVEMAVKEATQREELTKKLEELMLANEGGDDVTMVWSSRAVFSRERMTLP